MSFPKNASLGNPDPTCSMRKQRVKAQTVCVKDCAQEIKKVEGREGGREGELTTS